MKNKYIALIIAVALTGCVSLEEDLTGQSTVDKFFQTEQDFESFIAGAYTPLVKIYGTDVPYVATAGAEDVNTTVRRWQGFEKLDINSVSNPDEVTDILWNGYYSCISACNTMIQIASASELDSTVILPKQAEAKFLRAFSYFNLVRWFGEVPILDQTNQPNASYEEQNTVEAIYDFIVSDLTFAETNLPETTANCSKPNRLTAKALLAKVYIAMAGYPLGKSQYYASARDKAAEVIAANVYDLEDDFRDLWYYENRLTNSEFMFTLFASADNGTGSYVNRAVRPWDGGEGGWGDWHSDSRFLDMFPVGNGNRLNGTFYLTTIDGTKWDKTDYAQPYVGKLRDGGVNSGGYWGASITNLADGFFCMLRYADVLLVYAEAANQAEGSPSTKAYEAINKVRFRAGLVDLSGLNKTQFDKAVLDERNWELAFECNRWFDLCRREMVESFASGWYSTSTVDKHCYLLPKPTDQLAIMKGVHQNDGYTF